MSLSYDPFDLRVDKDPWGVWTELRERAPLYRNEARDFYALSRFADVHSVLTDFKTYSSRRGNLLEVIDRPDGERPRLLSFMDPPEHQRLRGIVSKSFSPAAVAQLEDGIRARARSRLDRAADREQFDFVVDFAQHIPVSVICSLMGIPAEDHDLMRQWTDAHMACDENGERSGERAFDDMRQYVAALASERARRPQDDMLSAMVHAKVPGPDGPRALNLSEILDFMVQIINAGSETSTRLMGWSVVQLSRHPEQRRALARDPGLAAGAIEEILRYDPPLVRQARLVDRDVTWHGQKVSAGSKLLLLIGAASRDPREFERPDAFLIDRKIARPLAFSAGIHHCLGAALARLEGRVVLEELLARSCDWEVDEGGLEFAFSTFNRGYGRIPVRLH